MSASLKGENGARRMSNRIPDDAMAPPSPERPRSVRCAPRVRRASDVDDVLDGHTWASAGAVEPGDERAHANAAADCSVSSEPRKKTILPPSNRHQCCMYIAAVRPVAVTV